MEGKKNKHSIVGYTDCIIFFSRVFYVYSSGK